MVSHTPADDPSRVRVDDHRQVEEPLPRGQVSDVRAPQRIGTISAEPALHQVIAQLRLLVTSGGPYVSTTTHAAQLGDPHQARHPLAAAVDAVLVRELSVDAWDAIRAAAARMNVLDRAGQRGIGHRAR